MSMLKETNDQYGITYAVCQPVSDNLDSAHWPVIWFRHSSSPAFYTTTNVCLIRITRKLLEFSKASEFAA
jgi:hypothetical protein